MLQEQSTHELEFNFPLEFLKLSLAHRIGFGNKSGSQLLQRFHIENPAGILFLQILIKEIEFALLLYSGKSLHDAKQRIAVSRWQYLHLQSSALTRYHLSENSSQRLHHTRFA